MLVQEIASLRISSRFGDGREIFSFPLLFCSLYLFFISFFFYFSPSLISFLLFFHSFIHSFFLSFFLSFFAVFILPFSVRFLFFCIYSFLYPLFPFPSFIVSFIRFLCACLSCIHYYWWFLEHIVLTDSLISLLGLTT